MVGPKWAQEITAFLQYLTTSRSVGAASFEGVKGDAIAHHHTHILIGMLTVLRYNVTSLMVRSLQCRPSIWWRLKLISVVWST